MVADIEVKEGKLIIKIKEPYIIYVLEKEYEINLKNIEKISIEKVDLKNIIYKIKGLHIPYVIYYGIFMSKNGLILALFKNQNRCLTIVTKNEIYKEIILELDNKEEIYKKLKILI